MSRWSFIAWLRHLSRDVMWVANPRDQHLKKMATSSGLLHHFIFKRQMWEFFPNNFSFSTIDNSCQCWKCEPTERREEHLQRQKHSQDHRKGQPGGSAETHAASSSPGKGKGLGWGGVLPPPCRLPFHTGRALRESLLLPLFSWNHFKNWGAKAAD